ncbi:hypothetical protein B0T10DRAFT_32449 [Thelonectria olida]|uniref:RBR-type E3 ubiquitin transferase n=1 Tax=Thelonectria olida TaxID=1576542 RepID=A0A9P8WJ65_9HYPO|nr:hypothetical protein B0T10DRAFT_32449 [Thelonectria olida]
MAKQGTFPLDSVHPELVDLMLQGDVFPEGDEEELSEDMLAEAVGVAVSLTEYEQQLELLSRFMAHEEIAQHGLRHPQIQNTDLGLALTSDERVLVRRGLPEPEKGDPPAPNNVGECIICTEAAHLTIPCDCAYCFPCLRELLRGGLQSEQTFPPRCCQPIEEATVHLARQPGLVHLFRMCEVEFSSPAMDRLYCYDGQCATFIPRPIEEGCPACGRHTCAHCGRKAHPGHPCGAGPQEGEEETEDVWAVMDENGVINCPGCGRMLDLIDGCNHITCSCGEEFCYLCGVEWHTCRCPSHAHHERRRRVADRPGAKPRRWRRTIRVITGREAELHTPRQIPQLRPWPGSEPLAWSLPRRRMRGFLRPLVRAADALAEQQRREEIRLGQRELPAPPQQLQIEAPQAPRNSSEGQQRRGLLPEAPQDSFEEQPQGLVPEDPRAPLDPFDNHWDDMNLEMARIQEAEQLTGQNPDVEADHVVPETPNTLVPLNMAMQRARDYSDFSYSDSSSESSEEETHVRERSRRARRSGHVHGHGRHSGHSSHSRHSRHDGHSSHGEHSSRRRERAVDRHRDRSDRRPERQRNRETQGNTRSVLLQGVAAVVESLREVVGVASFIRAREAWEREVREERHRARRRARRR